MSFSITHLVTPEHTHKYRLPELLYMTTETPRQPDGIFSSFTGISKSELGEGKH